MSFTFSVCATYGIGGKDGSLNLRFNSVDASIGFTFNLIAFNSECNCFKFSSVHLVALIQRSDGLGFGLIAFSSSCVGSHGNVFILSTPKGTNGGKCII